MPGTSGDMGASIPCLPLGPLLTAPVLCCRASRAPARLSVAWGSSYFTLKQRPPWPLDAALAAPGMPAGVRWREMVRDGLDSHSVWTWVVPGLGRLRPQGGLRPAGLPGTAGRAPLATSGNGIRDGLHGQQQHGWRSGGGCCWPKPEQDYQWLPQIWPNPRDETESQ